MSRLYHHDSWKINSTCIIRRIQLLQGVSRLQTFRQKLNKSYKSQLYFGLIVRISVDYRPRSLLLDYVRTCAIQKRRLVFYTVLFWIQRYRRNFVFVLCKHRGDQIFLTEMKAKIPKCKFSFGHNYSKRLSFHWIF